MNQPFIEIEFEDEGKTWTVTMDEIRKDIGWEYNLGEEVRRFGSDRQPRILKIKINGKVVWEGV